MVKLKLKLLFLEYRSQYCLRLLSISSAGAFAEKLAWHREARLCGCRGLRSWYPSEASLVVPFDSSLQLLDWEEI